MPGTEVEAPSRTQQIKPIINQATPQKSQIYIDAVTIKNIAAELCPMGAKKNYLFKGDLLGYCGYENQLQYCLPHHLYVPEPNGSLDKNCVGCVVWQVDDCPGAASVDNREIIGGYICVMDFSDPLFNQPPPLNGCPKGTTSDSNKSLANNGLRYECISDTPNKNLENYGCLPGYDKVRSDTIYIGNVEYNSYVCGYDGFKFGWEVEGLTEGCGTSGALNIGGGPGGNEGYTCAYVKEEKSIEAPIEPYNFWN